MEKNNKENQTLLDNKNNKEMKILHPDANPKLTGEEIIARKLDSGELEDRGGILFDNGDDLLDLKDIDFLTVGED